MLYDTLHWSILYQGVNDLTLSPAWNEAVLVWQVSSVAPSWSRGGQLQSINVLLCNLQLIYPGNNFSVMMKCIDKKPWKRRTWNNKFLQTIYTGESIDSLYRYIRIKEDLEKKTSCTIVMSANVINCYVLLTGQQLSAMCCEDKTDIIFIAWKEINKKVLIFAIE